MPSIQVPIIRGDRSNSNTDYSDKLPKNMIAVAKEIKGAQGYLTSHDGLTKVVEGYGLDRGAFYNDRQGIHYRLSGSNLVKLSTDGKLSVIGKISGNNQASMAYSFNNQLIVVEGKAYLSDGNTLSQITDPDLGSPIDGCWIDAYFFYTDGEYIYHSQIDDESKVDPLQYATAEFMPDKSLGVIQTQDNLVMVLGRYSIEYFINQANQTFAFSRIVQKSIKGGIVGTHCKAEVGGVVYILGGRKGDSVGVHAVQTGTIIKVSTKTVDEIISKYSEFELSKSVLESRTSERDQVLIVRLPRDTLVLNVSAMKSVGPDNAWTTLSYNNDCNIWLGANGVFDPRMSKFIYGSTFNADIYELDKKIGSQGGKATEFEFYTPMIDIPQPIRIGKIELNTVTGFTDSKITMSMSVTYDGVFDGAKYFEVYGSKSAYSNRYIIRRAIGYVSHEFGLSFRCVTDGKINVSGLEIEYG